MRKLTILDILSIPDEMRGASGLHKAYDSYVDYSKFEIRYTGIEASEDEICELVKDADILLTDALHFKHVTRKIIESGKNLKLILCPTVGYDEVDIVAAREHGIPVANSGGISGKPIAEYTLMSAIYLLKSIKLMDSEFQKGNWSKNLLSGTRFPLEFGSLTLGIIGCGSIGQEIARLAKVFGTRTLYHNRNKLTDEVEQGLGIEYSSFEDILRSSDVLSINVPLTDETRGMLGVEEIAMMKEGFVLINTARGGIVDERSLADALKRGHLLGAAVDVFENEPDISGCPLIGLENVLLTPHMSSRSPELHRRVAINVSENLDRICEDKPPLRVVN